MTIRRSSGDARLHCIHCGVRKPVSCLPLKAEHTKKTRRFVSVLGGLCLGSHGGSVQLVKLLQWVGHSHEEIASTVHRFTRMRGQVMSFPPKLHAAALVPPARSLEYNQVACRIPCRATRAPGLPSSQQFSVTPAVTGALDPHHIQRLVTTSWTGYRFTGSPAL